MLCSPSHKFDTISSVLELTLDPLGFSPLWFEPGSGHMWESQVLLTDGQVVFLRVLRFSPTFDERSARYKWNILERAVKPKSKKKKKKKKKSLKLSSIPASLERIHLLVQIYVSQHEKTYIVPNRDWKQSAQHSLMRVFIVQWRFWSDFLHAQSITKTCLYNFDPLKPHFYMVKLGFTGVYMIFLISA